MTATGKHEGIMDALAPFHAVRHALDKVRSLGDAVDLADKAQAAMVYCRRAKLGIENFNLAAEAKIWAERRAGEFLAAMAKHKGRPAKVSHASTLSELGITRDQSSRWQRIADIPTDTLAAHLEERKVSGEEITTAGVLRLRALDHETNGDAAEPWRLHKALGELANGIEYYMERWPAEHLGVLASRLRDYADAVSETLTHATPGR